MRSLAKAFCIAIAFIVVGHSAGSHAAPPSAPLSRKSVVSLLAEGTETAELLQQCSLRGLSFVCTQDCLTEFEKAGADVEFLNAASRHSVELRSPIAAALKSFSAGEFLRVIQNSDAILARSPRVPEVLWLRGRARFLTGDVDGALVDFEQLSRFSPDYRFRQILDDQTIVDRGRHGESVQSLLLEARLERGEFQRVIEDATRIIRETNERTSVLFQLRGDAHRFLGQHSAAVDDYSEALLISPRQSQLYASLGEILALTSHRRLRNSSAARELAGAALHLASSPDETSRAKITMAGVQSAGGDFVAAVSLQAQALETINKDSPDYSQQQTRHSDYSTGRPVVLTHQGGEDPPGVLHAVLSQMVSIERGVLPASTQISDVGTESPDGMTFRISTHEVTREQWGRVLRRPTGGNPDLPIDRVSWNDCLLFVERLNRLTPGGEAVFRLPSEHEWELAARAGTDSRFFFGDDESELNDVAWNSSNSEGAVHPVGRLKPNANGLFDAYGNVSEWCIDPLRSSGGRVNRDFRIHRGGSFSNSARFANSVARSYSPPADRTRGVGLRLAMDDRDDFDSLLQSADPLSVQGFARLLRDGATRAQERPLSEEEQQEWSARLKAIQQLRDHVAKVATIE